MEMEQKVNRSQLQQPQNVIDLVEVFQLLLHRWKLLFVALLAGSVLGGAYCSFLLETTYRANASLYVVSSKSIQSVSDLQLSSALIEDYTYIIKSRTALERVIDELQLDMDYEQLGSLVSVTNPDSSRVISISVTTNDPEMSRNIANSLLNVSVEQINQIIENGKSVVIDESVIRAVVTQKPSMTKYIMLGAMLGFVLIAGILVVRMLMDTTIKSEEDVERYLGVPLLSNIPYVKNFGKEERK
jgi:capsular polysaccharide biosynthesis protein